MLAKAMKGPAACFIRHVFFRVVICIKTRDSCRCELLLVKFLYLICILSEDPNHVSEKNYFQNSSVRIYTFWNGILNGGTLIEELYRSASVRISAILETRIYFNEKGLGFMHKNLDYNLYNL